MKKFIFISPFQPSERFTGGIYEAVDNEKLEFGVETKFPIIPTINGYAEEGEEIKVITVVSEYENAKKNYVSFKEELNVLAEKKKLKVNFIEISIPFSNGIDTQLDLFSKLIDQTADEDTLFCDTTYGSKPLSQILLMSVNYGYRIHKDVIIGCTVYGEREHNGNKLKIYDITSLIFIDEIVRTMAENKISNPTERIKSILK